MIEYVTDSSPFYLANKTYCEGVVEGLKGLNAVPFGFCNSYGYEIKGSLAYNNLSYSFHFEKHQSTQNGIIVPVNALNYAGVTVRADGLGKQHTVKFGKSTFWRMLTSPVVKSGLPAPYYAILNSQAKGMGANHLRQLVESGVSLFNLKRGKVLCKLHVPHNDPKALFEKLDQLLKQYH